LNIAVVRKADASQVMRLKAILLDFDGVIAETDNHHVAAWQRTLSTMGWQIPDDVAARSAEIDDREFLARLFAARGVVSHKLEEWVRRKQVLTVQMLKNSPRLYPGSVDLIQSLRGRVKLAVVSGTWRENIQAVLDAAGLFESFDTVVGKEDVAAAKPAPEAYELALKKLRISAKSAVAIEDSPSGVASARAAGIRVIAVGHRHPFGDWVGESLYVSGFEPVAGLIEHLKL
jgi:beta-phosphoglucomutase